MVDSKLTPVTKLFLGRHEKNLALCDVTKYIECMRLARCWPPPPNRRENIMQNQDDAADGYAAVLPISAAFRRARRGEL
jgi:hypothetical protein